VGGIAAALAAAMLIYGACIEVRSSIYGDAGTRNATQSWPHAPASSSGAGGRTGLSGGTR